MHPTGLTQIILAGLLGEGEFLNVNGKLSFRLPFNEEMLDYIRAIVGKGMERKLVLNRSELIIEEETDQFKLLYSEWYEGDKKIYSSKQIDFHSIILWANIYGKRMTNGIAIRTTINKEHKKNLIFSLFSHLNTPVVLSTVGVKLMITEDLYRSVRKRTNILHSTFFSNLIDKKHLQYQKYRVTI
ncbi:hypothetical protein LCY76_23530 [Fictibacillus sp. KIGAM418]|uniref:Uncharacterized protein n=1 Tax=Fictibacillus marinisediminis TaxID=2878389 RepID=A0A9X1XL51_9BACL|nr:hypothetical protein [Fictibacillus marinisediminis]MCK6259544.1 hypothetical protein [Fictibacillus marinisediminis]